MEIIIDLMPSMMKSLWITTYFAIIVWILSLPIGIAIGILRLNNNILSIILKIYINLMRGTPLLLQLMFIYFGLPYIGITFQREEAAFIAFIINYAAYFAEIFRGGIQSIDKGQFEAAKILGISKKNTFIKIILPQVYKRVLSTLGNEATTLIKDTSLIYILGISELMKTGRSAVNTLSSLIPFVIVGILYYILINSINLIFNYLEKKYSYYE